MSVFQILVLDADPWTVKMATSLLQRRGHTVLVASSTDEAAQQITQAAVDLLIVDAQLNGSDLGFVAKLRGLVSGRVLPVLLLAESAPPALRIDALRVPHSDFLDKPFRFDEFDLRVDRLLVREPPQVQALAVPEAGLRGTLGELSLATLLLLIESEQKSGVLTVQRPGEVGRMWCAKGRLLSGERTIDGQKPERSMDAVFELLSWQSGSFDFVAGPQPCDDDEGLCITQLVLLLAQRQDEDTRQQSIAV